MSTSGRRAFVQGAAGVVTVVAVWWLGALTVFRSIGAQDGEGAIPTPIAVVRSMVADGLGFYWRNVSITMTEAVLGFAWGTGFAVVLAGLVLLVPWLRGVVSLAAVVIYCIPAVAIGPIVFILVGPPGDGEPAGTAIFLAGLFVVFTTVVGSLAALDSADPSSLDVVAVLGGGRLRQLRTVRLVSALPGLLAALKIAAPASFMGAVIGEYIGGVDRGLGPAMIIAQQTFDVERVWGLALTAGLIAGSGYLLFHVVSMVAVPWVKGEAR